MVTLYFLAIRFRWFPHLLSDFGWKSTHNATEHTGVSWESAQGTSCFLMGVNVGYNCECFVEYFEIGEVYPVPRSAPIAVLFCWALSENLRKPTTFFVMSVGPHATTRLPLDGFSCNFVFAYILTTCRENSSFINLLKPPGHVMHHQFNIQQLYALPTLYLCVLYLSGNKQRLVPLTA